MTSKSPEDSKNISDEYTLLRKVHEKFERPPNASGLPTYSTQIWQLNNGNMSVSVKEILKQYGYDPKTFGKGNPYSGIVAIKAGDVRRLGFIVSLEPTGGDPSHVNIYKANMSKNLSSRQKEDLQNVSKWYASY